MAVVKLLLETGRVRVDYCSNPDGTPLYVAAKYEHAPVVELLLATGRVDVNRPGVLGSPLELAVESGHEEIVKGLLATGKADVRTTGLLQFAIGKGYETIAKMLKEYVPTARGCCNACHESKIVITQDDEGRTRVSEHKG